MQGCEGPLGQGNEVKQEKEGRKEKEREKEGRMGGRERGRREAGRQSKKNFKQESSQFMKGQVRAHWRAGAHSLPHMPGTHVFEDVTYPCPPCCGDLDL